MSKVQLTIFCYYSYFFSAVFSIACILSSMVDLMRNLWTNVGLVDRESRNQTEWTKHWRHMFNIKVNTVRIIATIEALTSKTHKYDRYGKNQLIACMCPSIFAVSWVTPCFLLGLANPMHSAYGLELVSRVEDRLHQQHMSRFDDVQTIGAGVERKEKDVDLFFVFEGAQILLEHWSQWST